MEHPDRSREQGGRTDRQPGKDDQGDVGSDPRRTWEKDDDRDIERPAPRRDQRPNQTPKTA